MSASSVMSSGLISSRGEVALARRMTLRSSRTLPGQECARKAASAAADSESPLRPTALCASSRKVWASSSMSSGRSRSAGIAMGSTFSR